MRILEHFGMLKPFQFTYDYSTCSAASAIFRMFSNLNVANCNRF